MIILGIDTSLRSTGYGIIRIAENSAEVMDCGVIKNKPKLTQLECLYRISEAVKQIIKLYNPSQACIEGAFFHKNAKTAMILGMARGAALSAVAASEIPVFEYSPKTAKLAVTGTGNASKEQVSYMMSQVFGIDTAEINDDATDALALAFCHFNTLKSGTEEKFKL